MSEAFGMAVEVLREIAGTRESELTLTAAEAQALLDALPDFLADADGKPLTGLTVESGYAPSIYPDHVEWGDYFKSYGEVVHELTEANKWIAAMRESLHQSLHPQTTDGDSCRYCDKDWPL